MLYTQCCLKGIHKKLKTNSNNMKKTKVRNTTDFKYVCFTVDVPCTKLTVKSTKLQQSFSGQYIRMKEPLNGRPAYKHTTLGRFLYLIDAQTKFWLFGTELGKNRGLILAHTEAQEPAEVKVTWRSYDRSDMTWKDDDSVSLQCDDKGRHVVIIDACVWQ